MENRNPPEGYWRLGFHTSLTWRPPVDESAETADARVGDAIELFETQSFDAAARTLLVSAERPGAGPADEDPELLRAAAQMCARTERYRRAVDDARRSLEIAEEDLQRARAAARHVLDELARLAAADDAAPAPPAALPSGSPVLSAASPEPGLRVRCFGGFEVTYGARLLEGWTSRRGQSVFKYLLLARPRPVHRDVLMEMFWPELRPRRARNNLNGAIHAARKAFATLGCSPAIVYHNDCYAIDPALRLWADIDEFALLIKRAGEHERGAEIEAAIACYRGLEALYRGPLLEEDRYDEWVLERRAALNDAFLDAMRRRAGHHLERGEYPPCMEACHRVLEMEPADQSAHQTLMRCFARMGQPARALQQYSDCVHALRASSGAPPSPATMRLRQEIRAGIGV